MRIEIGEAIPLATLRAAWLDRVSVELNEDARQRVAGAAGTIDAAIAGGGPVYGVNTGCGHLVHVRIGETELRKLQGEHRPFARRGRGRGPRGRGRAPRAPDESDGARPRALRRPPRTRRGARRAARTRGPPPDSGSGLRRGVGRPGAAGAPRRRAHRRGRSPDRKGLPERHRSAPPGRTRAVAPGAEGGTGAPERDPGLDGAGPCRRVPDRERAGRRAGRRRDVHRRHQGQRRAVRSAHPRDPRPSAARSRSRACSGI